MSISDSFVAPIWAPDVSDVAILIAARTFQPDGSYGGTFNVNTRPTDNQVSALIGHVCSEIAGQVGPIQPPQYEQALRVAALGIAAMVEMSFFPEQVASGKSPYPDLDARYDESLQLLRYAVAENGEGESMTPVSSFPDITALRDPTPPGLASNAAPATTWLEQF